MPLAPRFGISPKPVSREFAREGQFNGLSTRTKPLARRTPPRMANPALLE